MSISVAHFSVEVMHMTTLKPSLYLASNKFILSLLSFSYLKVEVITGDKHDTPLISDM